MTYDTHNKINKSHKRAHFLHDHHLACLRHSPSSQVHCTSKNANARKDHHAFCHHQPHTARLLRITHVDGEKVALAITEPWAFVMEC